MLIGLALGMAAMCQGAPDAFVGPPPFETASTCSEAAAPPADGEAAPPTGGEAVPDDQHQTGAGAPAPATDVVVTARHRSPQDPLEGINVKSFQVTQALDGAVIGPVAHTYAKIVPVPVQVAVSNALYNLHEPVVFLNYALQLKPGKAIETLGRFLLNSTVGIAGLIDVAAKRPFHLPRRPNGFADTLGYYGVKPGAFLFAPIVGATTVRDLVGTALDRALLPFAVGKPFNRLAYSIPVGVVTTLDRRAALDEKLNQFRNSQDAYEARRDYYLKSRQAEIDRLHGRPACLAPEPTVSAAKPTC